MDLFDWRNPDSDEESPQSKKELLELKQMMRVVQDRNDRLSRKTRTGAPYKLKKDRDYRDRKFDLVARPKPGRRHRLRDPDRRESTQVPKCELCGAVYAQKRRQQQPVPPCAAQ